MHKNITLLLVMLLLVVTGAVGQTITGASSVCTGNTTVLYGTPAGGTWTSSNPAIATVGVTSGAVSGVSAGVVTITYESSMGPVTKLVTVNATPAGITGSGSTCVGNTTTLGSATPGGTWSSSHPTVAAISSAGVVTGMTTGTSHITYALTTGCRTSTTFSVNAAPAIMGSVWMCNGTTKTLTATSGAGTWASSNPAVANFTTSTSGVMIANSEGQTFVTYTSPSGCTITRHDSVRATPPAISGPAAVCSGGSITLSNSVSGGTWSSGSAAIATAGAASGVITGVSAGVAEITYTIGGTCSVTHSVSVNPSPASISGPSSICSGSAATLTSATAGGTWSSSSSSVATISSAGIVSAISPGTAVITYSLSTGCYATKVVTVSGITPVTISGTLLICGSATPTLSASVAGGSWASSDPAVATVGSATGVVTGTAAGTAVISYTVSGACGTSSATAVVTVAAMPTITGVSPLCVGLSSTLSSSASCGTWSSSSASVASVGTLGTGGALVTGVTGGSAIISFTACGGCVATMAVSVPTVPSPILGASSVCLGSSLALDDTTVGGLWSSSNPSVATIATVGSTPGVVTGVSAGTTVITYALSAGCATTMTMTIHPPPVVTASIGTAGCGGGYVATASGAASYSWLPTTGVSCPSCAATAIASSGVSAYTVTGTALTGCSATATVAVGGNRIFGHISFTGAAPAVADCRVWLIKYDPSDSSIVALDSVTTCMDSAAPFYQFTGKPAGNYFVKAKLLSSVPGTSDYMPGYGFASPYWHMATTIVHGSGDDSQHIRLSAGTVVSGPGFISGYVYAGAGKGTAGDAPVAGMLVYLRNAATGVIINYAYTGSDGRYSFSGLPWGSYIVYPEEMSYYTIPSPLVTLGPGGEAMQASFKKHTDYGWIKPADINSIAGVAAAAAGLTVYPNPGNGVLNIDLPLAIGSTKGDLNVTDITGRTVFQMQQLRADELTNINISALQSGIYFVSFSTADQRFIGRFTMR